MYTYGNITSQIHVNVSYPTKYDNGRIIYVIPMCCSCTVVFIFQNDHHGKPNKKKIQLFTHSMHL